MGIRQLARRDTMSKETLRLDVRYHRLICDVIQRKEGIIFPYVVWNGQVLSQRDFVNIALEKIGPALKLVVTLQYRLDEPEKLETFTQRTSQEIRRKAKGSIPKNINIQAGLRALRGLEISPPFLAFLMPTPEEIAQIKVDLGEEKKARQCLVGELKDTRTLLTEAERGKQVLQQQIEQLKNSRLSSKIRRIFSRSKAAPE